MLSHPHLSESDIARFMSKMVTSGLDVNGCWDWCAAQTSGYGVWAVRRGARTITFKAHSLSYVLHRGPIDEGLELDHLCSRPICCNPVHLEPVTPAEHRQRTARRRGEWRALVSPRWAEWYDLHPEYRTLGAIPVVPEGYEALLDPSAL